MLHALIEQKTFLAKTLASGKFSAILSLEFSKAETFARKGKITNIARLSALGNVYL